MNDKGFIGNDPEDLVTEVDSSRDAQTTSLFGDQHKEHLLNTSKMSSTSNKSRVRKRLTFAAFALTYFTMSASYSVIAPFFPTVAKAKGASKDVIGIIFGIFALATFIVSPIVGILVPILGIRFLFFSGTFIIGVAELLFGLLNKMPDGNVFIIYSLVLRIVDGIGGAAAMTAAVACLAQCFPDNVGAVMGGLESFAGIGLTLGPLLGGVLYQYGGFGMPFFVLAGMMLATLPVIMCILPPSPRQHVLRPNAETTSNLTMMTLLKIPSIDILVCTSILGGMGIGIVEPTLAIHLKSEFGLTNTTKLGIIFFMLFGGYTLSAPLAGWLADKTGGRWVMTTGCLLLAIGFFLLGPIPLSFIPKSITLVYISMVVIGTALGPFFTPSISEMEIIVKARGYPDNLVTHGLIAGLYEAAFNIGTFIGPTCGGIITDYIPFPWMCTGFGILLLIQTLFLLGLTFSKRSKDNSKKEDLENPNAKPCERVEGYDNLTNIQT